MDDHSSAPDLEFQAQFSSLPSHTSVSVSLVNDDANDKRVIENCTFDPNESLEVFLAKASMQLDMIPQATHAYSSKGILLTDCLMIDIGDTICLSHGKQMVPSSVLALQKSTSLHRDLAVQDRLSLGRDKLPNKVESYMVSAMMGIDTLGRQLCIGTGEISGAQVGYPFNTHHNSPPQFPTKQCMLLSIKIHNTTTKAFPQ